MQNGHPASLSDWAQLPPHLWAQIAAAAARIGHGDWHDPARTARICLTMDCLTRVCPASRVALNGPASADLWAALSLAPTYKGLSPAEVRLVHVLLRRGAHWAVKVAVFGCSWNDAVLRNLAAVLHRIDELHLLGWHDPAESLQLGSHLAGLPALVNLIGRAPVRILSAAHLQLTLRPDQHLSSPQQTHWLAHGLLTSAAALPLLAELTIGMYEWIASREDLLRLATWCPGLHTLRLIVAGFGTWPHDLRALSFMPAVQLELALQCSETTVQQALGQLHGIVIRVLALFVPALQPELDPVLCDCTVIDLLLLYTRVARQPLANWPGPAHVEYGVF